MSNVLNKLQIKIRIKVLGFPLHVCSFQEAIVSFPMCAGVLNLSPTTLFFRLFWQGWSTCLDFFTTLIPFLHKFPFCFSNAYPDTFWSFQFNMGMCFRILECSWYITRESKLYMKERRHSHGCSSLDKWPQCSGSKISQGAPTPKRGCQPIIWRIFPENCMKMKKIEPRGKDTLDICLCRSVTDLTEN